MPVSSFPLATRWRTVAVLDRLGPFAYVKQVRRVGYARFPWDTRYTATETRYRLRLALFVSVEHE